MLFMGCTSPESYESLMLSNSNLTLESNEDFEKIRLKSLELDSIPTDSLFIQVAYQINPERVLLTARSDINPSLGLKFILANPKNNYQIIDASRAIRETWTFHPQLFAAPNKPGPAVVLAAQGTSESWGQAVFLLYNDSIREIGYLDVARKEKADTSFYDTGYRLLDIGPFTEVAIDNHFLQFRFLTDSVFLYGLYGGQYDVTLDAERIKYVYNGDELSLVIVD